MASASGIGNLSTLIKRLEAATSRLEDLTISQSLNASTPSSSSITAPAIAAGAGGVAAGGAVAAVTSASPAQEDAPAIVAWDESIVEALKAYRDLSAKLGGVIQEQAAQVTNAFKAQRDLIETASRCIKPSGGASSPVFASFLKPLQAALTATSELRDKNRGDKTFFNHLSTVSEGIPAVGWVAVEPKPGPFVGEMKDSAQFYSNRVIKDYKDSDKSHVEWCRSFIKLLDTLKEYVMKNHTTGLVWNPKGVDASSYSPSSSSGASAAPPAPPGPLGPPPPPPPPAMEAAAGGAAGAGGIDAVFAQLNQGEGITKSLKKVDKNEMTHKNPNLRGNVAVSASSSKPTPPKPGSKPGSLKSKKPARTELEGNKWAVEYHEDNKEIIIDNTELSHTVTIFGCKNSVIQVRGKVNAVSMVNCVKTSLLIDTLVSSLEITSSPSFTVQVTGRTPTVLLDATDSGQLYLSKESLDAEIITAKCSAINVSVPVEGGDEGEFREMALPEQLLHKVMGGKVKTEVVAHSG